MYRRTVFNLGLKNLCSCLSIQCNIVFFDSWTWLPNRGEFPRLGRFFGWNLSTNLKFKKVACIKTERIFRGETPPKNFLRISFLLNLQQRPFQTVGGNYFFLMNAHTHTKKAPWEGVGFLCFVFNENTKKTIFKT